MHINSIKAFLATGILFFTSVATFAQAPFTGTSQFRKFSLGVNVGALRPSLIMGGANDFTKPLYTIGYGADLKYQFTHHFGAQLDYVGGKLKGNNDKNYYNGVPATDRPISAFETKMNYSLALSGFYAFGNINWIRPTTKVVPYITAGGGVVAYKPTTTDRVTGTQKAFDNGKLLHNFFLPVGIGLKINLSEMINLDLGYRANVVDNDNFDGTYLHADVHRDKYSYGFIGLEFAFGKSGQKQLIFNNPASKLNDILQTQILHLQTEVDSLKLSMKDSDGDGVPDLFDREPNTPAGCPVDSHGVTRDTDGDGVPDCKDKELITPTECQPVDADGVGKCPDPACCKNMDSLRNMNACKIGDLPSISFRSGNIGLSNDAKAMLATIASKLKNSAECSIVVTGYPAASKASQALANKRVNAIKSQLTEKEGISADRISTSVEVGGGDANTVDIKSR